MRDPYDVLGVQKNASGATIKSAFRKLAKKLHPDANKNDQKAAAKFAELNAAYEIVGDEDKRKAFDRGEIDAEGKPRFQGFPGGGFGGRGAGGGPWGNAGGPQGDSHFESFTWGPGGFQRHSGGPGSAGAGAGGFDDILKEMFGGMAGAGTRGRRRTQFEPDDFGQGAAGAATGQDVSGTVTITLEEVASGTTRRVHLPTGKEVEAKIPAGLTDGQTIRLKGQGLPGMGGGPAGDALITVSVAPHSRFERDGANLRLELPVALYEAVLGGRVRVPTLDGAVELAIPANTSSGRTLRVKGKGLPGKDGTGDLYATVRIVLPDQPDPELEALMKKWRDGKPYDPRRDRS
ncbi:MAG: DnaJ domain-containing protein [Xanthobacteraceae bacterium]|nr:DnaJ domain-containing protein [Xanthobacteraceae bacterium]